MGPKPHLSIFIWSDLILSHKHRQNLYDGKNGELPKNMLITLEEQLIRYLYGIGCGL